MSETDAGMDEADNKNNKDDNGDKNSLKEGNDVENSEKEDDEDDLVNIEFPNIVVNEKSSKDDAGEPPSLLIQDEDAIIRCFGLSLNAHKRQQSMNSDHGKFQPLPSSSPTPPTKSDNRATLEETTRCEEEGDDWIPGEVPLPKWAIDPISQMMLRQSEK